MSQTYYSQVAGQWDNLREKMFSVAVREAALERAALHPQSVAADIGGGTGFLAEGLAPHVAFVHLVDSSPEMLAVARQNLESYPNIAYHPSDGASLPLPDASVDAALANMYLHHAPDPQAALNEMARIVKPGGRLVLTDLDAHTHTWLREEHHDAWLGFDRQQVEAWLHAAGLVNVRVESTHQSCASESQSGQGSASISIFVAVAEKPQAGMQASVADHYRRIALSGSSCCSSTIDLITLDQIGAQPASSCCAPAADEANPATISLGCGNPVAVAGLQPGEVVLDIGSGAGADIFPAARRVGPGGRAIGIDLLPEMIARAEKTAREHGFANVEFRQGTADALPAEDRSVDVVMSNCVINLVSDKGLAFREAYRVLKPGGRLSISDIVTDRPFSPALRADPEAWAACVSGALSEAEYLALVRAAGFQEVHVERSQAFPAEDGTLVYSLGVQARKP